MNKKNRMLKAGIYKNGEKIDEIILETNRIKKVIRKRKQKHQYHRQLSLRVNEINNSKTEIGSKAHAFKQIISLIEEVKEQVKLKIKEKKDNSRHS